MNARVLFASAVLSLLAPALSAAQGAVSVHGSAGTLVNESGNNQSVSVGFSPHERWDLLINAERIHLPTEVTGSSATRGGTSTFVSGEVRFLPLTRSRFSPYVLASVGGGKSRPNVNDLFPGEVTNDVWLMFFGGGANIPVTTRFSLFADVRAGIQGERDTIFLLVPVRGGITWRF
jgi:hypothetical protein